MVRRRRRRRRRDTLPRLGRCRVLPCALSSPFQWLAASRLGWIRSRRRTLSQGCSAGCCCCRRCHPRQRASRGQHRRAPGPAARRTVTPPRAGRSLAGLVRAAQGMHQLQLRHVMQLPRYNKASATPHLPPPALGRPSPAGTSCSTPLATQDGMPLSYKLQSVVTRGAYATERLRCHGLLSPPPPPQTPTSAAAGAHLSSDRATCSLMVPKAWLSVRPGFCTRQGRAKGGRVGWGSWVGPENDLRLHGGGLASRRTSTRVLKQATRCGPLLLQARLPARCEAP